ncbi:PTS sugar transporter subunit IIB [Enterococcus mediterraneensis]|uniref:PTS sugar transporter subunit IIB n=1 Tax=Enterococcus mediterraneensis TaxID=2364791 RepID=UPI000F062BB7|nr:PTS sugar transporter subunit IIB [Enterococcus mediterraneensis]
MIKLVRIDHRLLHGQVIFSWTKQMNVNHIVVADNNVPNDPIAVMALTIAKPADCKLDIVEIKDVPKVLEKESDHNYMILLKGPEEALNLTEMIPKITEINLGGVAKKKDSIQYGKAVYLDKDELSAIKNLIAKGINIFVQQVPSSSVENVDFKK